MRLFAPSTLVLLALGFATSACAPSLPERVASPAGVARAGAVLAPSQVRPAAAPSAAPDTAESTAGEDDLLDLARHVEPRPARVLVLGLREGRAVTKLRGAGFRVDVIEADRTVIDRARQQGFDGPVTHMAYEQFAADRGLRRQDYREFERARGLPRPTGGADAPLPSYGYGLVMVNDAAWAQEAQDPKAQLRPLRWEFLGDQVAKSPVVVSREEAVATWGSPIMRGRRLVVESGAATALYHVNTGALSLRTTDWAAWPEEAHMQTLARLDGGARRVIAVGIFSEGALRLPDAYGDGGAVVRVDGLQSLASDKDSPQDKESTGTTTAASTLSTEGAWGGKRAEPPAGTFAVIEGVAKVGVAAAFIHAPTYTLTQPRVVMSLTAAEWRVVLRSYDGELDTGKAGLESGDARKAEAAVERAVLVLEHAFGAFAPLVESYRFASQLRQALHRAQVAGLGLHAAPLVRHYGAGELPERAKPSTAERTLAEAITHFGLRELERVLGHDKGPARTAAAKEILQMDPPNAKGAYERLIKLRTRASAALQSMAN